MIPLYLYSGKLFMKVQTHLGVAGTVLFTSEVFKRFSNWKKYLVNGYHSKYHGLAASVWSVYM